jgi:hypothetical protein
MVVAALVLLLFAHRSIAEFIKYVCWAPLLDDRDEDEMKKVASSLIASIGGSRAAKGHSFTVRRSIKCRWRRRDPNVEVAPKGWCVWGMRDWRLMQNPNTCYAWSVLKVETCPVYYVMLTMLPPSRVLLFEVHVWTFLTHTLGIIIIFFRKGGIPGLGYNPYRCSRAFPKLRQPSRQ